jgi:DNA-binding MarR family transcriptional regulator
VRVPTSFAREFPDASRRATETFLNIGALTGAVGAAVDGILATEGLSSRAAFNVLSVLGGDPSPLRPSVVAGRMMVTRATVTGLIDSLERRGLVRRTEATDDGRSRPVALTPAGRRIVRRLVPRMHRFERELMRVLSNDELDQLLAMVTRLQARIEELAPEVELGIR